MLTPLQQSLSHGIINLNDPEKVNIQETVTNFETMRAIVREFQGQVTWGPIGDDKQLTQKFRNAFYLHKNKGILDYFLEPFHPYGDFRDFYFQLRDNLSPAQIHDLHQFVIDFSEILLNHLHNQHVRWYINFSNRYHADQTNPKFKGDEIEDIEPTLKSMLETSKKALQNGNGFTSLQSSLMNSHTNFFSKRTVSDRFIFEEKVSQLDGSYEGGNDLTPLQKSLANGMK